MRLGQAKRSDGVGVAQRVQELLRTCTFCLPLLAVDRCRPREVPTQRLDLDGCRDHRGDGESPIEATQSDQGQHDGQCRGGKNRKCFGYGPGHQPHVAGDAGDEISAPGPFDVALRKVENPDDDFFAKVGDNALADAGEQVVAHSDEKG